MATHTLSTLTYISRQELAQTLRSKTPGVTIIDVRDSDYVGGHILGCMNVPTHQHDYKMPELVRTLQDKDLVVFHCALSQQRGPASALRYLRERDRMLGTAASGEQSQQAEKLQRVCVLDGGFVKWQESYGEDGDLTEGYVKDIWQNY